VVVVVVWLCVYVVIFLRFAIKEKPMLRRNKHFNTTVVFVCNDGRHVELLLVLVPEATRMVTRQNHHLTARYVSRTSRRNMFYNWFVRI